MLDVRNIAFSYGSAPVLRDVSFMVSPGEVVSVVGGNGAGKTTLLRVLATLAMPDAGLVMLDGQDALARPLRYRRQIGYMPESVPAEGYMKVRDYLEYRAVLKGELSKRIRRRVNEAMELCRIGDIARSHVGRLSFGLRKRVALAEAILLRPRVLLLDDFLAGLDTAMRETAGQVLSDAAAFSSVIATGHEIADMARWTTRFLVLEAGVINTIIPAAGAALPALVETVRGALKGGAR